VTDPNGAAGSSGHEHPARQSSLYASKSTSRPRRVGATLRSHVVENAYGSSENALLFGTRRSESSMNDNLDPKADLHPLSLGIVAPMVVPVATAGLLVPVPKALAQPGEMEEVVVTDSLRTRYLIDQSTLGSKFTESLRDTPQSVTLLSQALLEDRNVMTLDDALRNVPGITLSAGEFKWMGNGPTIRGFPARNDMYIDGIRDL